jgi:hypothetical protein
MTISDQAPESAPLEHAYTVTHYVRPAGNLGGWSQVTSAERTAEAAIEWIAQRVAEVEHRPVGSAQTAAAPLPAGPEGEDQAVPAEGSAEAPVPAQPEAPVTS